MQYPIHDPDLLDLWQRSHEASMMIRNARIAAEIASERRAVESRNHPGNDSPAASRRGSTLTRRAEG